jgi:hypothetical protein
MEKAAKKSRTDVFPKDDVDSKMTTSINNDKKNILTLLDENSLLQVLLRTRCEDHSALRQTCRCFQSIIDSALYRQQRAQQEWAQVETHILTAPEHYKKNVKKSTTRIQTTTRKTSLLRFVRITVSLATNTAVEDLLKTNFVYWWTER